ncbi:MAG TPA: hypothetical protein VHV27_02760 [Phenylobacterium sp.]|jgi:hypothetical protein|nr:hypothetical protein [Phenylobacterium sp.]
MAQVGVRRRHDGRGGSLRRRLNRWIYRQRPQFAVIVAFAVACLLGIVAASVSVQSLGG